MGAFCHSGTDLVLSENWLDTVETLLSGTMSKQQIHSGMDSGSRALPDLSVVYVVALPPDAWLEGNSNNERKLILDWDQTKMHPRQPKDAVLPLAYVSPRRGASGHWIHDSGISGFKLAKKVKGEFDAEGTPFVLPANPSLLTMAAGSSAAVGHSSSRTLTEHESATWQGMHPLFSCFQGATKAPELAAQFSSKGKITSTNPAEYVLVDGGFVDNTAVTFTLSAMQSDCESKKFDCSGPLRLLATSREDGDGGVPGGFSKLFSDGKRMHPLFGPTINEAGSTPYAAVFKERYPTNWETILTSKYVTAQSWTGTLTTIDNRYFGVKAGSKVTLSLIFNADVRTVQSYIVRARLGRQRARV